MLILNNLKKNYHTLKEEVKVLDNISFKMNNNEFISIVGPSGCGKSTILSIISNVLDKSDGEIIKDCSVGYMFQNDLLFDWLTVFDNCLLGVSVNGKILEDDKEYVNLLLEKYGLIRFAKMYPTQLSGGMRQRIALIRTLVTKPDILLLDEPFSAIDYKTRIDVACDIYDILKKENKGFILVTHDIEEAISMSNRVLILTKSPSYIKKEVETDLFGTPKEKRKNINFFKLVNQINKEIESNVQ